MGQIEKFFQYCLVTNNKLLQFWHQLTGGSTAQVGPKYADIGCQISGFFYKSLNFSFWDYK